MINSLILSNGDIDAAPSSKNKIGDMFACFICGNEVFCLLFLSNLEHS